MNSRQSSLLPVAAFLIGTAWVPVGAADFSGYLVLTSDYAWRGVTMSDGNPAAQLGAEMSFDPGIYLGLWASTIDIDNGAGLRRDTEVIYYAGYSFDATDRWSVAANVLAYTYPGQTGYVDYDYQELSLSLNYADRAWLEYAYTPDLYHTDVSARNIELYTEWPAGPWLIVGAGAGYYDVSNLVGTGYGYWELGVTWPLRQFDFDLRYHDTNRAVPIISNDQRADSRVVLTFRLSF